MKTLVFLLVPCIALGQSLTKEKLNGYRNPLENGPARTITQRPGSVGVVPREAPPKVAAIAPKASADGIPAPVEGRTFTIKDLNANRFNLSGQVVRVRLQKPELRPEQVAAEMYRVFIIEPDFSADASIDFPTAGTEKLNLLAKTKRSGMSFYVLVRPDGYLAVGRSYGSSGYAW